MVANGCAHFRWWISGSIRRKLTLFVMLVCFMLIGLFWVFGVQMLQPAYTATIRKELTHTLDVFTTVLDNADRDGIGVVAVYEQSSVQFTSLSQQAVDLLNAEIQAGNLQVDNLCIDIATSDLRSIFLQDYLPAECVLHKTGGLLAAVAGRNGDLVVRLRSEVFSFGTVSYTAENQMVLGRLAANGSLSVIISANLERIPQAVQVLRRLMFIVSLILLCISVLCAAVFSRWFTRPLTRLSGAAQQMAKGDYNVNVQAEGCDEIAKLSDDFNAMAREVKRSADMQRDLIANVSHDLRTPLTIIKGYAETVRDLTGEDPRKRTEQLSVIVDETDRLSALVGSVMELTRMQSGHERPSPVRFDMGDLCEEVAYRYRTYGEKRGFSLHFEAEEGCEVLADPALLERALDNLLGNALAHIGPDGYVGLRVRRTAGGRVRVEVADHGPGIAEADLPHLFDRYYRSRADSGKTGTGLGLSITKAIFEASGFTYGVESAPGQGATFWFEAPSAAGGPSQAG